MVPSHYLKAVLRANSVSCHMNALESKRSLFMTVTFLEDVDDVQVIAFK